MPWIWMYPAERLQWGADFDYDASVSLTGIENMSDKCLPDNSGLAVYKSTEPIERFKSLHCPPFETYAVVDQVWQNIILQFVPKNRIQFYPVKLVASNGTSMDYSWIIPFDRVRCIDADKSTVTSRIDRADISYLFGLTKVVHRQGCLAPFHLARDEQQPQHLLVSNDLKEALAKTGESSMFHLPETCSS